MTKLFSGLVKLLFFALIMSHVFTSCKTSKKDAPVIDAGFTSYISGFTSGVISVNSGIQIRLMEEVPGVTKDEAIEEDLFSFSPKIAGNARWIDNRTIEFRPEPRLKPGTLYKAKFYLSKIKDVSSRFKTFEFQFQTMQQAMFVNFEGLKGMNEEDFRWQQFTGNLKTADYAEPGQVEKVLQARQNNNELKIKWQHSENGMDHLFVIDSILRTEKKQKVEIQWNGAEIGVKEKGSETLDIPSLSDFNLMNIETNQQPEQYVALYFSDPVKTSQDMKGLIYLKSGEQIKLEVSGNVVKVFPVKRMIGSKTIFIENSLKNSLAYPLAQKYEKKVMFTSIHPEVVFIGDGVIMPDANGWFLPFKAVNLSAVNVKVVKIYEKNVAQFFQNNQYSGARELNRVGRIILKKEVPLTPDKPIDFGTWNVFSLDLSKLIKTEPGAIYRVYLGFDRSQSLYPCGDSKKNQNDQINTSEDRELDRFDGPDGNSYYYYGDEDYYYEEGFNWREKDDPCKDSYYMNNMHVIAKNVLASDLGILAKSGEDNRLQVVVTNLLTSDPMQGVELDIYNYQNQLMRSENTGSNGMAEISLERKPFLLVAKKGGQRGYLRLDDGSALSVSMFDVSGQKNKKGVKGFIYGDRGVWRPDDSIYLTFVLEDKMDVLPATHPVVMELYTPENQLYLRKIKTSSVNGFYDFRTATGGDAPTGNWLAKVKVGGSVFTKTIRIETVKPNRLKINIDFGTKILKSTGNSEGILDVKWLHGAPASNLKADIELSLGKAQTKFDDFPGYLFDDPSKSFETEDKTIFEGKLNEKGRAVFFPKISVGKEAPGMLQASFKTRVFEKSGNFSIDRYQVLYSPFRGYVGLKIPDGPGWNGALYSDETNLIPVVTVDEEGKPVSRKDLQIEIYKVSWRWWWERDEYDNLSRYVANKSKNLIQKSTISTVNGKAMFEMKFDKNRWGRHLIRITDPATGHSTGAIVYLDYKGWWDNAGTDSPTGAEMLAFSTDKDSYQVGEKVIVNLPDIKEGRALVSIETGSKIVQTFWKEAGDKNSVVEFETTSEMAPNAYIHISLIQPFKRSINDLPIRLYGIQMIKVFDPQTKLEPLIRMPDELAPEKEFSITVSEAQGKKMTYTIAVVDEGLLDLTRFRTPDPWNSFYAREALGIKTWDMYKYVVGAFTGEMAGLLSIGGDEYLNQKGKKNTNRFKPVVHFIGPFELEEGKSRTHSLTMPNYIGSVRTMVVAGYDGAYGSAEKATPVKKPLMVLATLPRVVSPAETVTLPVTVFAMDEKIRNVKVKVKTNSMFEIAGPDNKKISFDAVGDQVINFTLKAADLTGQGVVEVFVESGNEKASDRIEIKLRLPNPPVTKVMEGVSEKGQKWQTDYQPLGIRGTNTAVLEVSSIPGLNLEERTEYLITYPHGCIEQTISAVFPQLFMDRFLDLSAKEKAKIQENVIAGINRIKSFQLSNGGLTYWPGGSNYISDWGTSYAGNFMLEAKAKGYQLPLGFLDNWVRYQTVQANSWSMSKSYFGSLRSLQLTQAYRLYTLALAKKPALGAMNRMREMKGLAPVAEWRLAAAYLLIGKTEIAKEMVRDLSTTVMRYKELSYTYGSTLRDQAMILEVLSMLDDKIRAKKIFDEVAGKLGSTGWYSTQTTAFSLIAIAKFIGEENISKELDFEYSINGETKNVKSGSPLSQVRLPVNDDVVKNLSVTNKGKGTLYISVQLKGVPMEGAQESASKDLEMGVRYYDMDGNRLDISSLAQGTDFIAEVTVHHPGIRSAYKNMALTQVFPSGWEIRNIRMDNTDNPLMKDKPRYQDIRDDRVFTYFDLQKNETKVFRVILNASYLGDYYLPVVYCEAMYDKDIYAIKAGRRVKVVEH